LFLQSENSEVRQEELTQIAEAAEKLLPTGFTLDSTKVNRVFFMCFKSRIRIAFKLALFLVIFQTPTCFNLLNLGFYCVLHPYLNFSKVNIQWLQFAWFLVATLKSRLFFIQMLILGFNSRISDLNFGLLFYRNQYGLCIV